VVLPSAHTAVLVAVHEVSTARRRNAVAETIRTPASDTRFCLVHLLKSEGLTMQRPRRNRGTATVEYVILLMVIVLPFSVAMVAVANHLVPFFDCIEYLNGLSLP
jgi:hypothetical protein